MARPIVGEGLRFLIGGGINTLLSYFLYLIILFFLPYMVAYTLAYFLGIIFSYAINTWWVFRQPWSWFKLFQFPLVYIVQYLIGIGLLYGLVTVLGVSQQLAPLIAILLTLPLTFLMSRWIINRHE